MIFELLLLVLMGVVAFFHYIQGFFGAALSAVIATIAAVIAVSYHEPLAMLMVSKFPDTAAAIALVAIFAAVYFVLRLAFDAMVPGNVRLPVVMEKVGAGVMGVVVGLIGTGILAIAAQTLPYSPTVGGYARFKVGDTQGHYQRNGDGQWQDVAMHDLTDADSLDPAKAEPLWFHQADLVIGLTNKLSGDGGALSNDKPLASIHPDYLDELFGQRLGIQLGAKHTLVSPDANPYVKVTGVYTQLELHQVDGELRRIRHPELSDREEAPKLGLLKPDDGQEMLIVRTVISGGKEIADDADLLFRFSPGSIRLMARAGLGGSPEYKDYNPIAILDARGVAITYRIDDYILAMTDKPRTIDFVFFVDVAALKTVKPNVTLNDGTFLEVKRYGRVDLSNKRVVLGPPINTDTASVILKPEVDDAVKKAGPQTLVQPEAPPAEKK